VFKNESGRTERGGRQLVGFLVDFVLGVDKNWTMSPQTWVSPGPSVPEEVVGAGLRRRGSRSAVSVRERRPGEREGSHTELS